MAYHNGNTLRAARDQVPGHDARVLAARAALGRANCTRPENRRQAQSAAFRALNAARAALRQAVAVRDAAGAALLALGGTLEPAQVRPDPLAGFGGVRIEDDPDMAAFLPRPASPIAPARATATA